MLTILILNPAANPQQLQLQNFRHRREGGGGGVHNFFSRPDLNSSLVLWACRCVHGKPAKPIAMWVVENNRRYGNSLWSRTCNHGHSFCCSGHPGEQSAICYHSGTGNYYSLPIFFAYRRLEPESLVPCL